MRGMLSILAVVVVSPLLLASSASAETCTITNTGPGSTNECIVEGGDECTVTNNNDIDITNDTDQNANTGDADVDGNTDGGNAESGDAVNESDTSVNIGITNGGCNPQTTSTPGGGGQTMGTSTTAGGRGAGAQVNAPVGGVGAGAGGAVASVLALSVASTVAGLYRLRKLGDGQAS